MNVKVSLDHLVVAAADLASGVKYVNQMLGIEMHYGGEHNKMGTHNHLMSLGSNCFLEIIAVNPDAKQPTYPRWYGLDDPFVRESISRQPRLIGWVINTNDIGETLSRTEFTFGEPELISRGDLNWYFCLPEDGRLLAGGFVPYVMKWNTDVHPAGNMAELGCEFVGLEIHHPNAAWLRSILKQVNADQLVTVNAIDDNQTANMIASIDTPYGLKQLSSNKIQIHTDKRINYEHKYEWT